MSQEPDQEQVDTVRKILSSLPQLARTSWSPVVSDRVKTENISNTATIFGGNRPFRPDNFRWPICEECNAHKAFVCQLNVESLPVQLQEKINRAEGLFQLFYCLECMPLNHFKDMYFVPKTDFVPSLKSLAATVAVKKSKINTSQLPYHLKSYVEDYTEHVPLHEVFGDKLEMKVINSWTENNDKELPLSCETDALYEEEIIRVAGVTKDQLDSVYQLFDDASDHGYVVNQVTLPHFGIKIGGYIRWCQV